jgi:hypothetical protein
LHDDYWDLENKINRLCLQKANLYSQGEKRGITIKQIQKGTIA